MLVAGELLAQLGQLVGGQIHLPLGLPHMLCQDTDGVPVVQQDAAGSPQLLAQGIDAICQGPVGTSEAAAWSFQSVCSALSVPFQFNHPTELSISMFSLSIPQTCPFFPSRRGKT